MVHGEPKSAKSFAELLKQKTGCQVDVPAYREEAILY
jgi:hypothetical protein